MVYDVGLADERADKRRVLADVGVLKPMDDSGAKVRQADDQQVLPQHVYEFIHTAEYVSQFQTRVLIDSSAATSLYFDNLTQMGEKLRGGVSQHLRIAASETVLRTFLPGILQNLRKKFSKLKVSLREGYHPQVLTWLSAQEIDLSIGLIGGKPPSGVHAVPLFDVSLGLLVQKTSKLKSADELWNRDRIEESFITVPSNEPILRAFGDGLAKRKVEWISGIEVSSVEMVQTYVAHGYGIGVMVHLPELKLHPDVRVLPLPDFDHVTFGALWQGRKSPLMEEMFVALKTAAAGLVRRSGVGFDL